MSEECGRGGRRTHCQYVSPLLSRSISTPLEDLAVATLQVVRSPISLLSVSGTGMPYLSSICGGDESERSPPRTHTASGGPPCSSRSG